jgi:uncharacterized membrane protein YfbV (UPF0208 family)
MTLWDWRFGDLEEDSDIDRYCIDHAMKLKIQGLLWLGNNSSTKAVEG